MIPNIWTIVFVEANVMHTSKYLSLISMHNLKKFTLLTNQKHGKDDFEDNYCKKSTNLLYIINCY